MRIWIEIYLLIYTEYVPIPLRFPIDHGGPAIISCAEREGQTRISCCNLQGYRVTGHPKFLKCLNGEDDDEGAGLLDNEDTGAGASAVAFVFFSFFFLSLPSRRCRSYLRLWPFYYYFFLPWVFVPLATTKMRFALTSQSEPVYCRLLLAPEYTEKEREERIEWKKNPFTLYGHTHTRAWPSPCISPHHRRSKGVSADFRAQEDGQKKSEKNNNNNEKNEPIASWNRPRDSACKCPTPGIFGGFKGREEEGDVF